MDKEPKLASTAGADGAGALSVLVVEDEKSIVDILRFNLEKEGYTL